MERVELAWADAVGALEEPPQATQEKRGLLEVEQWPLGLPAAAE